MKKIIITESDLIRIVKKVLVENVSIIEQNKTNLKQYAAKPESPTASATKYNVNKKNIDSVLERTGYKKNSGAYILAKIIATNEGWLSDTNQGKGSRSYRNNNPGNLIYQEDFKTIDPKVRKEPNGDFAIFSSPVLGAKALIEKKIIKWAKGNMPVTATNQKIYKQGTKPTVKQFITTYAPPSQNDTAAYIKSVVNGVKPYKPNASQNSLVFDLI